MKGVKKPQSYCKQCRKYKGYQNRIFLTSDIHGNHKFCKQMEDFCTANNTTKDDILIISGDAGINYHCNKQDNYFKHKLSQLPITFLILHGNHEERAWNVQGYSMKEHKIGKNYIIAYQQPEYPNLLFLADYQLVTLNNKRFLFLGGAYSVDKYYRLLNHAKWFASEQIPPKSREIILAILQKERYAFDYSVTDNSYQYDYIVSHTCPLKYIPTETFLSQVDQTTVDNSTEQFLDKVEEAVLYKQWYCGHFHISKTIDRLKFVGIREIIEVK